MFQIVVSGHVAWTVLLRHRALAVESGTFVDDEGFALDRALCARRFMKLDTFARPYPPPKPTSDRQDRNLDLGIDIGGFANDEMASRLYSSLELTVDAQRVVKRDFALE